MLQNGSIIFQVPEKTLKYILVPWGCSDSQSGSVQQVGGNFQFQWPFYPSLFPAPVTLPDSLREELKSQTRSRGLVLKIFLPVKSEKVSPYKVQKYLLFCDILKGQSNIFSSVLVIIQLFSFNKKLNSSGTTGLEVNVTIFLK